MDIVMLTATFLAALGVSGGVVLAFSVPMDATLNRLLSSELAAGWSRAAKFAVFVAAFTGGLRLSELENVLLVRYGGGGQPLRASQGLLEVFKSVSGSLTAASWAVLAFFAGALGVYGATRLYELLKPVAPRFERPSIPAGR